MSRTKVQAALKIALDAHEVDLLPVLGRQALMHAKNALGRRYHWILVLLVAIIAQVARQM